LQPPVSRWADVMDGRGCCGDTGVKEAEDQSYCYAEVASHIVAHNVLALGAVADFGVQNCQYATKVDAR
jgi:hypothetical protein